jgi:hypothetical protein
VRGGDHGFVHDNQARDWLEHYQYGYRLRLMTILPASCLGVVLAMPMNKEFHGLDGVSPTLIPLALALVVPAHGSPLAGRFWYKLGSVLSSSGLINQFFPPASHSVSLAPNAQPTFQIL